MKTSIRPSSMTIGMETLVSRTGSRRTLYRPGSRPSFCAATSKRDIISSKGLVESTPWGAVPMVGNWGSATWSMEILPGPAGRPLLSYNGGGIVSHLKGPAARLKEPTAEDRGASAAPADEDLVGRVLAGEEDVFEVLVRRYQTRVLAHVARMVGNRDDALDLSQEIFLKVFGALDRYNPAYKFSTWVFRIAGNAAIDHLRKRRPRTVPLETQDSEGRVSSFEYKSHDMDPYAELRNLERGSAIARAIAALPAEFRELITLRHFGGLSYEQIAEAKQMPLGTVKNKLFRARAVLKDRLSGELS